MHDHNNKNNGHNWMMWIMMLPCFLLLLVVLIGGGKIWSGNNWQPLLWFGFMILAHVAMMKFMHGPESSKDNHCHENEKNKNEKSEGLS